MATKIITETVPPLVYVTLVNYRGWSDTLECLRALDRSDYPNFRPLVVDNGSGDESAQRLREARPDLELEESDKNLGFAGGENLAIRRALERGADYVWVLNNDTSPDPDALTAMVGAAEADPTIGAVGSVLCDMDDRDRVQVWGGGRVDRWLGRPRPLAGRHEADRLDHICGASMLVQREVFESCGLLDERFFLYWDDTDFSFTLRRRGWRLAVAENSRVRHKESASTGAGSTLYDYHFSRSAVRFFRKHERAAVVPILAGVSGRLVKRLATGRWRCAAAVWRGAWDA